jgi:1-deoxy-D-xylulose-5-phosphate reductoisomerase
MASSLKAVPSQQAQTAKRSVTVLGSTGSVGANTVELLLKHRDRYEVEALTANSNVEKLAEQAKVLGAKLAVVADETHYEALKAALSGTGIACAAGAGAVVEAAERPADWVMAAIVGAAGLPPTLAAARRGATLAFANKECLVCAGPLMMRMVSDHKATLLPVDSEHSAIYQVFDAKRRDGISKLILTASGGPFRTFSLAQMADVTLEQALKHPVWSMGAKISIDSATMMNKGLEIIEARYLFDMTEDKIDVVVHPQSIIHSMVEYIDGSVLAQLGTPDMKTPIGFALGWPDRIEVPAERLDFSKVSTMTFESPDPVRFPALRLARESLRLGECAPAILNAANEVAVAAFLNRKIEFLSIAAIVEETLDKVPNCTLADLDTLYAVDAASRRFAEAEIARRSA